MVACEKILDFVNWELHAASLKIRIQLLLFLDNM